MWFGLGMLFAFALSLIIFLTFEYIKRKKVKKALDKMLLEYYNNNQV